MADEVQDPEVTGETFSPEDIRTGLEVLSLQAELVTVKGPGGAMGAFGVMRFTGRRADPAGVPTPEQPVPRVEDTTTVLLSGEALLNIAVDALLVGNAGWGERFVNSYQVRVAEALAEDGAGLETPALWVPDGQ